MPQSLVIGNGNLLVNFDKNLQMTDVYYPFVGQENHSAFGTVHRIGVWVDGDFSWLSGHGWEFDIQYSENALVGNSKAVNHHLGIELSFQDFVYTTHDILFRRLSVKNTRDYDREVKVFFGHDFYLYGDKQQDTAQYEPDFKGVLHYRKQRYFCVSGEWESDGESMAEFSVGKSNFEDREGTWKDAEDGGLHGNPIEQGSVDSIIGFYRVIGAGEIEKLNLWVMAGKNRADIEKNYVRIQTLGSERISHHTTDFWRSYCTKKDEKLSGLPPEVQKLWNQSIMIIRSQTDNRGAIIASNDSDIMKFNKDTYTYMWPRDGALVAMTLSRIGYWEPVQRFLWFCEDIVEPGGYVMHKFNSDKSLGSSWHPKIQNGIPQLPIQEDESALILVALWEYYKTSRMMETVKNLFNPVILKIGHFLQSYIDEKSGLPKPSYDLWEERMGIFSYTAATVYAGLKAAENLSRVTGHMADAESFSDSAKDMKKAILKHLFCEDHMRFAKRIEVKNDGSHFFDATADSSIAFMWEMGVVEADDPRMISTMWAIEEQLSIKTEVGGVARYNGDYYQRNWDHEYSADVPGNPWVITTLWLANWYIETAKKRSDLKKPKDLILWATSKATKAGILPEQIDPFTNEPLSVAPLTWSHSTYIDTCQRFSQKWGKVK